MTNATPAGPAGRFPTPFVGRERELAVLRELIRGRTDREIADELSISHRTVMNHVSSILAKLDVPSRTAADALAIQKGIL